MTLTYLEVTNMALREINEVPIVAQDFITTRGLQQFAKQAINRAYLDIVNSSREWPWLKDKSSTPVHNTVTNVTLGQQSFPLDPLYNQVDWTTFYITDKDLLLNDSTARKVSTGLTYISYEEWTRKYRDEDFKEKGSKGLPEFVFMYPDKTTIGLSPKPDKQYSVQYDAWKSPLFLTLADDLIPFPLEYITVLISRARYYLWLFRENPQQAGFARSDYETGLDLMKARLLDNKFVRIKAI